MGKYLPKQVLPLTWQPTVTCISGPAVSACDRQSGESNVDAEVGRLMRNWLSYLL